MFVFVHSYFVASVCLIIFTNPQVASGNGLVKLTSVCVDTVDLTVFVCVCVDTVDLTVCVCVFVDTANLTVAVSSGQ